MAGGLMQLVTKGAQDQYLTAKPDITFFHAKYRRHTNFAMESIAQTIRGKPNFGQTATCTISRNGDLIHKMYLEIEFASASSGGPSDWSSATKNPANFGYKLIHSISLEIGGTLIDKHYGEWMDLWTMLSTPAGVTDAHATLVGKADIFGDTNTNNEYKANRLYVPLHFWFCRSPGLALPLIGLQYHEVKVRIDFNEKSRVWVPEAGKTCPSITTATLWVDYIYLDVDERRNFAKKTHEYIIEQVQCTGSEILDETGTQKIKLNFNHPVKELIWGFKDSPKGNGTADAPDWRRDGGMFDTAKVQLNGHDRFAERDSEYFRIIQPYQHHENSGEIVGGNAFSAAPYVYSFSLTPEEPQPSGTCNFSRIDNAHLDIEGYTGKENQGDILWLFATNYNVLRIMSGMGGLAYSN